MDIYIFLNYPSNLYSSAQYIHQILNISVNFHWCFVKKHNSVPLNIQKCIVTASAQSRL